MSARISENRKTVDDHDHKSSHFLNLKIVAQRLGYLGINLILNQFLMLYPVNKSKQNQFLRLYLIHKSKQNRFLTSEASSPKLETGTSMTDLLGV